MTLTLFQDDCQDLRDSFTGSSQDGYSRFPPSYNNYPAGDHEAFYRCHLKLTVRAGTLKK